MLGKQFGVVLLDVTIAFVRKLDMTIEMRTLEAGQPLQPQLRAHDGYGCYGGRLHAQHARAQVR